MAVENVDVTVSVPAAVADVGAAARARVLLVLDAVRSERLSYRQAALALGVSADRLLDLAREHGVPVTRYDALALTEDLATLAKLAALRPGG